MTEQKAKQAEFEVDDKSGLHVVAKAKGGKVLADVTVGKSTGPGTMVRPAGKDEIWQATGISRYLFDKSPADWRDKSITTFTQGDAEQIEVVAKDGAKTIVKKTGAKVGPEDAWEVVESSVKIDKLDNSIPNGIASALSIWKANDFADGVKLADAGLEPAALTVTVALKGGKKVTALIGNKKGEDEYYVKTPEAPQVFIVKKYNAERVLKRPIEFRDKTLCDIPDTDVTEIAVSHGDNSYTIAKSGQRLEGEQAAEARGRLVKVTFAGAFKEMEGAELRRGRDAEDQRPREAAGDDRRQGQGQAPTCSPEGRRRDQGQAQLLRDERQGRRRLPGAQVERRPRPGEARRPQEGRASRRRRAGQARMAHSGPHEEVTGRTAPRSTYR